MTRLNREVSNFLAFSLLVFQAILPWTAHDYLTQDGPSHLYNARAIAAVLFDPSSPFARFYQMRHVLSTNWGTVLIFNLASWFTVEHAEAVVATFSVVFAFFCFHYLIRSLNPEAVWSPLVNLLTSCWFLWAGFYNFYLATGLFALAVGYFLRHSADLTWRRCAALALLLVATFFTHVLPAAFAMLTIGILGFRKVRVAAALAPASVLVLAFLAQASGGPALHFQLLPEWTRLPSQIFTTTYDAPPVAKFWVPLVLLLIVLSCLRSVLGLSIAVCALLALFLPSKGFGGEEINLRIGWIVCVLGIAAVCSNSQWRRASGAIALITTAFLVPFLLTAMSMNVQRVSHAVAVYRGLTRDIPPGATVATVHYPSGYVAREFGYKGISLDPLYHADSWLGAQRGFVVLTDYQALSRVFALECRWPITDLQRADLWALEAADSSVEATLRRVHGADYILVFGNTDLTPDAPAVLVANASSRGFLRVYRIINEAESLRKIAAPADLSKTPAH
jgi:hypothetical protein